MAEQIQKIYDLKTIGFQKISKELEAINKQFVEIKKNKAALGAQKERIEDPAQLQQINTALADLKQKEAELRVELKKKQIEAKEMQLLRQQELNEQRRLAQGNQALKGSYNALKAEIRDLYNAVKATPKGGAMVVGGSTIGYDQAIAKLKQLMATEQEFRRQFQKDGTLVGEYTTGIIQAFQRMGLGDLVQSQMQKAEAAVKGLDVEFDKLKADLQQVRTTGQGSLDAIERMLIENRNAAAQAEAQYREMQAALRGTGTIGQQVTDGLRKGFANLKRDVATFMISYLGFQQAIMVAQKGIRFNADLSDALVDLQRVLDVTSAEVDKLSESLKSIETRTSVSELVKFATIAAKAGVAAQDIVGVTKAIDELNLVAGNDLGNVDEAVTRLVKLVNVFEGPGKVTEDNVRRYGNALVDLANKGVASGGYLVDFAQRLAGIEGISKIQIQSVLGLAAAFEEQGQSAEVASTAVTQVILKMGQDVPKYAAMAKITEDAFRSLLNSNPAEALIALAEGAKGNSHALDEISKNFSELEVNGVRVAGVLGVLADKGDVFREKIRYAGAALQDTTALTEGAARKQETFGAQLDKIAKKFETLGSNKALVNILSGIAALILGLLSNLPTLITLLGAWALGWAVLNKEIVVARLSMVGYNLAISTYRILLGATTILQTSYAAGLALVTGATSGATAATTIFGVAIKALPIGWILALLGTLAGVVVAVGSAFAGAGEKVKGYALQQKYAADAMDKARQSTAEIISKVNVYIAVLKDAKASLDSKRQALADLIALDPSYLSGLNQANVLTAQGTRLINDYIVALQKKAYYEAAMGASSDLMKQDAQLAALEYRLQQKYSGGKRDSDQLTADERKYTKFGNTTTPFGDDLLYLAQGTNAVASALAGVRKQRQALAADMTASNAVTAKAFISMGGSPAATGNGGGGTPPPPGRSIDAINKDLEVARKNFSAAVVFTKDYYDWQKKVKAYEDELEKADPKTKTGGGGRVPRASRLDAGTQDKLKDLTAAQNDAITALETAYQEGKKTEREYLTEMLAIQEDYTKKKVDRIGNGNAEERRMASQLQLDLIKAKKDTNAKLYQLDLDALEAARKNAENLAKDELDKVLNDPAANAVQKAAAQVNYDQRMITLQQNFMTEMDALEKQYNRQSATNAADRSRTLIGLQSKLNKDLNELNAANVDNEADEIEQRFNRRIQAIRQRLYEEAQRIYSNPKLSATKKARRAAEAGVGAEREEIAVELDRVTQLAKLNQWLFDQKLINEQQYLDNAAALAEQEYNLRKRFNDLQLQDEQRKRQLMDQLIQAGWQFASSIIQASINKELQKVDAHYDAMQKDSDNRKKVMLANAASEEERQAIEAKFDEEARQRDKKRAEERKAIAKKQLLIEFALASIKAISTSTNIYEGLIKEAIVALEFGAKLALLNSQSFARGGSLDEVLSGGGIFSGPSHAAGGIPFMYKGRQVEVEGQEAHVINKKSMGSNRVMTVTGTPAQLASAANVAGGGVDFAPGYSYGGGLGVSLQAPAFQPAISTVGADFSELIVRYDSMLMTMQQQLSRIAAQKVAVPVRDVTRIQDKDKKANSIGVL